MLISSFGVLISILNYNNFDDFLVAQLFKLKDQNKSWETSFKPTKFGNIIEYFTDLLPKNITSCCCKNKSLKQRGIESAREALL